MARKQYCYSELVFTFKNCLQHWHHKSLMTLSIHASKPKDPWQYDTNKIWMVYSTSHWLHVYKFTCSGCACTYGEKTHRQKLCTDKHTHLQLFHTEGARAEAQVIIHSAGIVCSNTCILWKSKVRTHSLCSFKKLKRKAPTLIRKQAN